MLLNAIDQERYVHSINWHDLQNKAGKLKGGASCYQMEVSGSMVTLVLLVLYILFIRPGIEQKGTGLNH